MKEIFWDKKPITPVSTIFSFTPAELKWYKSKKLKQIGKQFGFKKGNKLGQKFQKANERNKFFIPFGKGEKNPNWKGGISSLLSRIRRLFKYRQWRSDVFTRDEFTCQICGDNKDTKGNLIAHHTEKIENILQKYKIETIEQAIKCEELWNMNKGITLCQKCHSSLHRKEDLTTFFD